MIHRMQRAACLLLLAFAAPLARAAGNAASPAASDDPLLQAMSAELARSKAQLKMDQLGAPYYIEYRVFDVDGYAAEATFGALRDAVRARLRFLRVVVRLGDYKQDSYYGRGRGDGSYLRADGEDRCRLNRTAVTRSGTQPTKLTRSPPKPSPRNRRS